MDEYFKDIDIQKTYIPRDEETKDKPKKFVFQIDPENIDYVESLSYEEKYELINQLITNYREGMYTEEYSQPEVQTYTKLIISILAIIIMIPVVFIIINISLNLTNTNYKIYQGNVEKLFKNRY